MSDARDEKLDSLSFSSAKSYIESNSPKLKSKKSKKKRNSNSFL